jgi:hypothetical protein
MLSASMNWTQSLVVEAQSVQDVDACSYLGSAAASGGALDSRSPAAAGSDVTILPVRGRIVPAAYGGVRWFVGPSCEPPLARL